MNKMISRPDAATGKTTAKTAKKKKTITDIVDMTIKEFFDSIDDGDMSCYALINSEEIKVIELDNFARDKATKNLFKYSHWETVYFTKREDGYKFGSPNILDDIQPIYHPDTKMCIALGHIMNDIIEYRRQIAYYIYNKIKDGGECELSNSCLYVKYAIDFIRKCSEGYDIDWYIEKSNGDMHITSVSVDDLVGMMVDGVCPSQVISAEAWLQVA